MAILPVETFDQDLYRIYCRWVRNPQAWGLVRQWSGGPRFGPAGTRFRNSGAAPPGRHPTASVAINSILKDWTAGVELPGVGTCASGGS